MTVKLLTEHHLEFLSLKRGCTGCSESTLIKMPHCWKSHVTAYMLTLRLLILTKYHLLYLIRSKVVVLLLFIVASIVGVLCFIVQCFVHFQVLQSS